MTVKEYEIARLSSEVEEKVEKAQEIKQKRRRVSALQRRLKKRHSREEWISGGWRQIVM